MKKNIRKALLSVLIGTTAVTTVAATALVVPTDLFNASAATGTTRFAMVDGASIRYSEPLGLRFIAELGEQEYTDLKTAEDGVTKEMGMFIMPWSYIADSNDELTTTDYASVSTKLDYVFYSSDGSVDEKLYEYEDENGDTYYRANGVISNLKLQNYAKEFVGIGYIAETVNGEKTYTYTEICKEDNVRTSAYVAIEAHADEKYAENTAALSVFEKYIDGAQLYTNWGVTESEVDGVKKYAYNNVTYDSLDAVKTEIANFEYSMTLDKSVKYVKEKGTAQLNATIKDVTHNVDFAGAHAVYSSSDESVVKVDKNGKLTWVKNGTATITAKFAGIEKTCEVISGVIDFEDGKLPSQITPHAERVNELTVAEISSKNKVLQATTKESCENSAGLYVTTEFLGAFFEDSDVEYMAFDIKTNGASTANGAQYRNGDDNSWVLYDTNSFNTAPTDAFKIYYLPRSVYEGWVANNITSNRFIVLGDMVVGGESFYIDNIRAATAEDYIADFYSFEHGGVRTNNANQPLVYLNSDASGWQLGITNVDETTAKFTNEIVSDGMRALQFTKKAGISSILMCHFADTVMENAMRGAGYVSFDLYVPEGSNAKIVKNGFEWYGELKQGWNTIYEKVYETGVNTAGDISNELIRFTDTTASTYVIDNFRLLTEEEYNKAKFGFEAGGVIRENHLGDDAQSKDYGYYYAGGDKANNRAAIKVDEGDVANVLSDVRFATEQVHGGDYSLAIEKKAGYIQLSMAADSAMYASLKNGFTFWIYSTVEMNGTSDTLFINGVNGKLNGGAGVTIPANVWTQVTVAADDIHPTAGRFLIIQGATAGTLYLDDFAALPTSTITYDAGTLGTVDQTTQTVIFGGQYTLATPTAYRDFLGWYNGDELVPTSGVWNISGDVTLTARYSDKVSFEDGVVPTYMTKAGSTESLSVVESNGSKVLQIKATAGTYNPIMNVTIEFLDSFFDGTDVEYIAFEAKTGSSKIGNFRRSTMRSSGWGYEPYENDNGFNGIDTTYKTFFFSRADYDYWVANSKTAEALIYAQGMVGGDSIYVDNIRTATQEECELMMYSFGSGGVREYSAYELFFYSPLTTVADRTFGMLLDDKTKSFTDIGYVENGTDGNRAFQFTKAAGTVQLNFPSEKLGYTTIVTKTGYYAVDIYIPEGSDATFTYHTTEWSGVTPTKGDWNTFYGKENNVVQWTDTTGGTYLVDNIRSITQEEYEAALPVVEPVKNWYNAEVGETDENGVISGITLNASTFTGTGTMPVATTDTVDMSYYRFNGDYGLDDFLVFDFTGDNMPMLSFFDTGVTNTAYNCAQSTDVKGWIVANGLTTSTGEINLNDSARRLNLIGPNKITYMFDGNGTSLEQKRIAIAKNTPITMENLDGSTDQYRVIVGWVAHATNTNAMSLRVVTWNLTTGERIVDIAEGEASKASWTGDIALYGHFSRTTTVDKLYPVVEGLDNAIAQYRPAIERYNATWSGDDLILAQSTYEGSPNRPNVDSTDMSYIAYNGDYGFGDYLVFDFTGSNMPFVSFFNDKVTNTVYNNASTTADAAGAKDASAHGIVICGGLYYADGSIYDAGAVNSCRLIVVGRQKVLCWDDASNQNSDGGRYVDGSTSSPNPISATALSSVTDTYRVIIGFSENAKLVVYVYNMVDGTTVYNNTLNVCGSKLETGSIALHGQFGKTTVLDRVYGVEENTTLDALLEKYAVKDADYSDEAAVTLDRYGYASLSNGQWTLDGVEKVENPTDWRDATNVNSDGKNQYEVYKEAGFNIVLAQDMISPDVTAEEWAANGKKYMDYANEEGLKVILTDWHLQILSKPITPTSDGLTVSDATYVPWIIAEDATATDGLAKEWMDIVSGMGLTIDTERFATRDALDSYVRSNLSLYKDHPAFYGVMLGDEPSYHNAYCYSEIYKSIKRVMPECYVQYNLMPMESDTAAIERYYTGVANTSATSADIEKAYTSYVVKFLEAMGTDYIQYDDYPFKSATDGMWFWETATPYVDTTSLRNIQLVAEIAKERGLAVKVVTQSSLMKKGGSDGDVLIRQITEEDARWLNNYLMGFGVKQINYFTYWTKYANSSTGEYFEDGGSFVNRDGTTTAVYDFMKTIMANNTAFAPTISHFDYNASKVVGSDNGSQNNEHISWSSNLTADTSFRFVTGVSTSLEYTLVTELYDKDNYNYMYMVMNTIDPNEGGEQTVTVTFDSSVTQIYVYDQTGTRTAVTLESNTYEVKLTAGQAVYLLPY